VTTVKVQVRPLKEKMFSTVRKYYQDVGVPCAEMRVLCRVSHAWVTRTHRAVDVTFKTASVGF
jgi:hypothetical protein